jgi:hypothetical protein
MMEALAALATLCRIFWLRLMHGILHMSRLTSPLLLHLIPDKTVIHYRCGDLMHTGNKNYKFSRFSAFHQHISKHARSIGILTQPFTASKQTRPKDFTNRKKRGDLDCKFIVTAFADDLQERFPAAKITIHNDPNDSLSIVWARMIMANQTIVGIGTFGEYPAMATFGSAFQANKPSSVEIADNLNATYAPLSQGIQGLELQEMWKGEDGKKQVLDWFRSVPLKIRSSSVEILSLAQPTPSLPPSSINVTASSPALLTLVDSSAP